MSGQYSNAVTLARILIQLNAFFHKKHVCQFAIDIY